MPRLNKAEIENAFEDAMIVEPLVTRPLEDSDLVSLSEQITAIGKAKLREMIDTVNDEWFDFADETDGYRRCI